MNGQWICNCGSSQKYCHAFQVIDINFLVLLHKTNLVLLQILSLVLRITWCCFNEPPGFAEIHLPDIAADI